MYINSNLTPEEAVRLYPDELIKLSDPFIEDLLQELNEARAASTETDMQNARWSDKFYDAAYNLGRIAEIAEQAKNLRTAKDIKKMLKQIIEIANES